MIIFRPRNILSELVMVLFLLLCMETRTNQLLLLTLIWL
uniref:Uncharacterized protein n=1 Tax=Lotus japonicus TaxID=34305 RepID=I3SR48_LOTJA|nr:unknown [Lotus japonicus]